MTLTRHSAIPPSLALATLLVSTALMSPAYAETVEGVFALPGAEEAVSGEMTVTETGPLSRGLELVFADKGTSERIDRFDVELTQELHILAVDDALTTLVHRHVEHAAEDGTFASELSFPHPGLYHIFTDAVPSGKGQQVLRFDVEVGEAQPALSGEQRAEALKTGEDHSRQSSSNAYTVTLDSSGLTAGEEGIISLSVEKDGKPATDIEPYLGVAAHAVFVRAEDLAYVHAHAMANGAQTMAHGDDHGGTAGHETHDKAMSEDHQGMEGMSTDMPASEDDVNSADASHDMSGMDHATGSGEAGAVSPEMSVHVTPPAEGVYALWIEFIGGGEVQTVPFTVDVSGGHHH
ncbi:hypothetical protein IC608_17275 [Devosia sp. PTR5]|uniref:DUF4198 domain-containing protein n=1 Tax=Devosia oryzisoli TaxID=2774138 RepID=A0A927FYE3_9HYPH|nr:hypothetical protein [Devosia oryzisoli]MBD8067223.1 hypothetical protein [Devosia oryzisoli]